MPESSQPKLRILIIDDEEALLDMYKEKLVYDGYEVITATNGEKGLKKAIETNPDVILLDLIMPVLNGFDTLQSLKAEPKTQHIPVYLLTNIPPGKSSDKGKELGADGYLFKAGLEPRQLSAMMKKVQKK